MSQTKRSRAGVTVLALVASLLAGEAMAQGPQTDGVRITGTVNSDVSVGGNSNVAAGARSRARTDVGSVAGGISVDGRLDVAVQTGPITTLAAGAGQEAITSVGSVAEDVNGQTSVVVSTGEIINMSDPKTGRPACVVVGALGKVPGC